MMTDKEAPRELQTVISCISDDVILTAASSNVDEIDTVLIPSPPRRRWYTKRRIWFSLFVVIITALIITDSFTSSYVLSTITTFLEYVEGEGPPGLLAFVGVYVAGALLFLPFGAMEYGAGYIFAQKRNQFIGLIYATLLVSVSAMLSATIAFFLGRHVCYTCTAKWTKPYKIVQAITISLATKGYKTSLLLRITPIPFTVLNYTMGGTSVKFREYLFGMLALLPGILARTFIGTTFSSLTDERGTLEIILIVIGIVATILVSLYFYRYMQRFLPELEELDQDSPESPLATPRSSSYIERRISPQSII